MTIDPMTIDAETKAEPEPVVTVTEAALAKILELRSAEDDPETLGLRIEVTGVRGADFTYDLAFEPLAEAEADDVIHDSGGLAGGRARATASTTSRGPRSTCPVTATRAGSCSATPTGRRRRSSARTSS